jgi:hypothetical protein
MRINERESTSGMQRLQQDEAVFERTKGTCAYKKQDFGKIKPNPVKPL